MPAHNFKDLTGLSFGRLIVLRRGPNKGRITQWWCQCSCGNMCLVHAWNLRSGNTESCGCLREELRGELRRTHGMSQTPEYAVWCGMKRRCLDPRSEDYPRYGGRGITVCSRWQESFQAFYSDIGPRPSPEHTIEREDNDGPYSPENCSWQTRQPQARNTRRNRMITIKGETACLTEWLHKTGLIYSTFQMRLNRGWSIEDAMLTPPDPRCFTKKYREKLSQL